MILTIIIVAIAFFLGSIPTGYLISKIIQGKDVRRFGSGNIGATNVGRAMGAKWGILTLVLDIAKGVLAVLLARYALHSNMAIAAAGVMAIAGHNFSIFLKFKGGKGVATALGVFLAIAPKAVLPSLGVFVIMFLASKFVSLGSVSAAATFPLFTIIFGYPVEIIGGSLIGGILIIISHHSNIKRLIKRQENKFSFGEKNRNNYMIKRIAIIGGGSWGTALAIHLSTIGHPISLWIYEKDLAQRLKDSRENDLFLPGFPVPSNVKPTSSLEESLQGAEIVLSAVPSHFCRQVFKQIVPFIREEMMIVSATKGIENESLMRISQIINGLLKEKFQPQLAVLSGPSFAFDVARHHPTAVVIASKDIEVARLIQQEFYSPYFRLYTSKDVVGVELAGSFKNVIAIAAGVIDGLGYGFNTLAALITRGLAEITRMVVTMGGKERTMYGLAGIGDLMLTCSGGLSRNRQVGQRLGKGEKLEDILKSMNMIAEGVKTTKSVRDLSHKFNIEMPITNQVYDILYKDKEPKQAIRELMLRELKSE